MRSSSPQPRPGRPDRGQGRPADRPRPLRRRHQAERPRRVRHRGQRQPEPPPRRGGRRRGRRRLAQAHRLVPDAAGLIVAGRRHPAGAVRCFVSPARDQPMRARSASSSQRNLSRPVPPISTSWPPPRRSSPAPPSRWSCPSPPMIRSSPPAPNSRSSDGIPGAGRAAGPRRRLSSRACRPARRATALAARRRHPRLRGSVPPALGSAVVGA